MCSCLHMWLSPTSLFPMSLIPFSSLSLSLSHCVWKLFFSFRFFALKYPFHVQHMCLFLCAGCRVPLSMSLPAPLPQFLYFLFLFLSLLFYYFLFFSCFALTQCDFSYCTLFSICHWPPMASPAPPPSLQRQRFTRSFSLCVRFFTLAIGLSYSTFFLFSCSFFFFFWLVVAVF